MHDVHATLPLIAPIAGVGATKASSLRARDEAGEMHGPPEGMEAADHAASTSCLNCGAVLVGRFCHSCGQERGSTHRSLLHLAGETIEAFTHGDSRVLRTVRLLTLDPGRLTRDWLDGRRVRDVPPLRIFFIALFVLFLVASLGGAVIHVGHGKPPANWQRELVIAKHPALTVWLQRHVGHAVVDPEAIVREMEAWAERLVLLMLPIAALTLKALFAERRPPIPLYDHVIFGLHSLAFAMLLLAALICVDKVIGHDIRLVLVLLIPAHVYRHLRGAFGGGSGAAALRTLVLLGVEVAGLTGLAVVLALIGLEWG